MPNEHRGATPLESAGARIEELLDDLGALPDRRAGQWAEELVRLVTELYGAGIERILAIACSDSRPGSDGSSDDGPSGEALLERLTADELVSSLLIVHDLHPESLRQRLEGALSRFRLTDPEADVRLLDLDEATGSLRLRLLCSGPSAASPTAAGRIEDRLREAIEVAAPELEHVEVDRPLPSVPVALTRRSPAPVAG